MYHQLSLKETSLQLRSPPAETREGETDTYTLLHTKLTAQACAQLHIMTPCEFWACRLLTCNHCMLFLCLSDWKTIHPRLSPNARVDSASPSSWVYGVVVSALCCFWLNIFHASRSYLLRVRDGWLVPECPRTPLDGGPRAAEDCGPENGQSRRRDGACCDVAHRRYRHSP